jgi:hypothetical protein
VAEPAQPFDDTFYVIEGRILNAIWREVYHVLIEDDGSPQMAVKGDRRRDMAQRLEGLLRNAALLA